MHTIGRFALLSAFAFLAGALPAQADEWVKLGSRNVNFGADVDNIGCAHKGLFRKIKFKVTGNPIHITDIKVHFGNGSIQDVAVRANIPQGGETRVIDLKGAARVITRINLEDKTKAGVGVRKRLRRVAKGKATVTVFGKLETGPGPVAKRPVAKPPVVVKKPGVAPAIQWVVLGSRQVTFGAEKDTIAVTGAKGIFKRLKFKVTENGVHMLDMKVHYGNGEVQDVPLKFDIAKGGESRVIDLAGAARVIKKVVFRYKSKGGVRGLLRGKARLTLVGARVAGVVASPNPKTPVVRKDARGDLHVGKWEKLGSRKVNWSADRDTIAVTAADGRFTKLKFGVIGAPVEMLDMKVHYGSGGVQDVSLRFNIPKGGESRVIDLAGNKRVIKKVVFTYKTKSGMGVRKKLRAAARGKATVTLWGKH